VHLVGHSLGGAIAVEVAAAAPDRTAAVTLIAPSGLGNEIAHDFIAGFIAESRAKKLRPVLEMLVADPGIVTHDMVEAVLKFKRLDGALLALKAVAAANFPTGAQTASVRDKLAAVEVPVHVVWGEGDRVLPAHHADALPEKIKVTKIADAGHIPHMEKAAEVNAVIKGHYPV
jgi:pyruvate dehydrogenase E2 component (dihydrolipoamide acetyltransferase)